LTSAAAAAPPPLEAYGRLPVVEDIELSPAGDRIAFITVEGDQRRLVIQTLDGKERSVIGAGNVKVRDLAWAGPERLLITTSVTAWLPEFRGRSEWFQVAAYNISTRKLRLLLNDTPLTVNAVMGEPVVAMNRGEPTVFVRGVTLTGDGRYDLYRVDMDTGRGTVHAEGSNRVGAWVVSPDGEPVARSERDDRRGLSLIKARVGAGWREIISAEEEQEATSLYGLGRTEGTLLVTRPGGDQRRVHELTIADGTLSPPLDKADGRDMVGVQYDPTTLRPMALLYLGRTWEYEFLDPQQARAWRGARAPFKDNHVSLASWSADFKKLVLKIEGAEDAGTYFVVDLDTKKAHVLADAWPGVPAEQIGPVRWITYKAADGLEIPAYLTLPPGREAKNLPLVVLPHGGPQARDTPGFDWWSQALASRGYAVLQPQFRGSDGFGKKFVEAGYGEWGRKMQTDLSDGVRHLAREGLIDPKRVCITGGSYGGYAALAGPTLDPGVYRCAVSVNGVGDLAGMLAAEASDAGRANTAAVRYWSRFMGVSFRKRAELDAVSPTRQAARADAPILVIHGRDDTVVPYIQSADFVRAMQKAGKPVEFVPLKGEDHWLSRGATRLEMLRASVAFIEKHNPPD
jgi:dipeptidyl aminopeptidase/acylaminoacyl peptidase